VTSPLWGRLVHWLLWRFAQVVTWGLVAGRPLEYQQADVCGPVRL